jgi:hypothetical protein
MDVRPHALQRTLSRTHRRGIARPAMKVEFTVRRCRDARVHRRALFQPSHHGGLLARGHLGSRRRDDADRGGRSPRKRVSGDRDQSRGAFLRARPDRFCDQALGPSHQRAIVNEDIHASEDNQCESRPTRAATATSLSHSAPLATSQSPRSDARRRVRSRASKDGAPSPFTGVIAVYDRLARLQAMENKRHVAEHRNR